MLANSRDRISVLANSVLDDGDDLHITASFRASEENSSTVGNSSYTQPTPICNSNALGDDINKQRAAFQMKTARGMNKFNKLQKMVLPAKPRNGQREWSWRGKRAALRHQLSLKSVQEEYQAVGDEKSPPSKSEADSIETSAQSFRSSRQNAASGRTLLVRQKAQVMGRPSMAEAIWEVGSSLSTDSESTSRGGTSWEIASHCGSSDVSHLTGDSFSSPSQRSNFSFSRAMYINPGGAHLLGSSSNDEESDQSDREDSGCFLEGLQGEFEMHPTRSASANHGVAEAEVPTKTTAHGAREVVSRLLQKKDLDVDRSSAWDLFDTGSNEMGFSPTFEKDAGRQRVWSDSDFVFEVQRQRSEHNSSVLNEFEGFGRATQEVDAYHVDPGLAHHRSRTNSDSFAHSALDVRETIMHRQRCMSDSPLEFGTTLHRQRCMSDSPLDFGTTLEDPEWESATDGQIGLSKGALWEKKWSILTSKLQLLSSRAHKKKGESHYNDQEPLLADSSSHIRCRFFSDSAVSDSTGTLMPWQLGPTPVSRMTSNTDLPTSLKEDAPMMDVGRRPLQPVPSITSPAAKSAAKRIASALRAKTVLPATNPSSHDYYWNDDADSTQSSNVGEEVLWSLASDSFDDIL